MSFSLDLIFKKLHVLLPAPSHPSHPAIPNPGFPHAFKHGGFPLRVCEGHEPPGHRQGLAISKRGFPHALKHGGFPLRVCDGNEPPGHLQGLAIPKRGFPHALKHGGFPLRLCEGNDPWGPSRVPRRMEPSTLKVVTALALEPGPRVPPRMEP